MAFTGRKSVSFAIYPLAEGAGERIVKNIRKYNGSSYSILRHALEQDETKLKGTE